MIWQIGSVTSKQTYEHYSVLPVRFKINVLEFELERKRDDFSRETTSIDVRIKGEHAARWVDH